MTYVARLLIDGSDRDASDGRVVERIGPASGLVETTAAAATRADAVAAVDAARAAFAGWSQTGPNQRRHILLQAASLIEARAADFSAVVTAETGATRMWGAFNAKLAAEIVREAACMTTRLLGETIPADRPGTFAFAVRRPVGVMVGIAPWNAPVILGARAIAMPIACGNTVVMKSSEMCPATHRLIVDCFVAAGVPKGVANLISHAAEDAPAIVEALVTHPDVRRINFTGSTRVGKVIAALAARHLKPCLLELGGKAPLLVLDDADLDESVKAAAFGAFMNQGQICMSTERIILHDRIADDFLAKFKAKVATLVAGNPLEAPQPMGALVDERIVEHVRALVADAAARGATILLRGEAEGAVMQANVVAEVTRDMRIWSEESFGPVVCIARARDDAHAIALANDSSYGLSAAVYSRDIARAMGVASAIDSGICHINGPTVYDEAQMPFGGVKDTGYGRFGGTHGIDAFTETKWMTINTKPIRFPI